MLIPKTLDQPRSTLINLRSTSINLKLGHGADSDESGGYSREMRVCAIENPFVPVILALSH